MAMSLVEKFPRMVAVGMRIVGRLRDWLNGTVPDRMPLILGDRALRYAGMTILLLELALRGRL